MKVYIVAEGNYALSSKINVFSTKDLAEKFRKYLYNENPKIYHINIIESEVDKAVLNENDL